MVTIVQKEDPILRQRAAEVATEELGSARIKKVVKDMSKALASQDDGVAIAAPQIGMPLRIFIISGKVFADDFGAPEKSHAIPVPPDQVFINPVFKKLSSKKKAMEEGCLSVRWLYGKVSRAEKATIEAYDENGKRFTQNASGLVAQIFQHETDHLDGILFIDKADRVHEINPADLTD